MNEVTPQEASLVAALDEALAARKAGRPWQVDRTADLEPLLSAQDRLLDAATDWLRASRETPEAQSPTGPYRNTPSSIGRYQVEGILGSGGMGAVYRARDPLLGRSVAVKVPRADASHPNWPEYVARFLREARTAATVRHPNVCPVHDVGEQDGVPFVVMSYVEGETLARRLRERRRFDDPAEAVGLVRQIAEGLAAVHAQGLVHRDVKPANVLLDPGSTPLLTDFGLARIDSGERLTRAGFVVGTPAYMSPEQARGDRVGPASDIYSLGVLLYELLTGELPYSGTPESLLLHKLLHEKSVPLARHRPDLDAALGALVESALAREPSQRFPSAKAFAEALGRWQRGDRKPPAPRWPTRRAAGLALAGLAVMSAGVGWWLSSRPGDPTPLVPLEGELRVSVYSPSKEVPPSKVGLLVDQEGALPVRNGERVHLEVRLNRPAFVYLVWIDGQGEAIPLYPWDAAGSALGWQAPLLASARTPVCHLHCPALENKGFVVIGPPGLETAVLLARTTPLEDPGQLQHWIDRLSGSPLRDPREVAWLGLGPNDTRVTHDRNPLFRGLETGKVEQIDVPLFSLLEGRLRPKFELLKAVRFAHAAK